MIPWRRSAVVVIDIPLFFPTRTRRAVVFFFFISTRVFSRMSPLEGPSQMREGSLLRSVRASPHPTFAIPRLPNVLSTAFPALSRTYYTYMMEAASRAQVQGWRGWLKHKTSARLKQVIYSQWRAPLVCPKILISRKNEKNNTAHSAIYKIYK